MWWLILIVLVAAAMLLAAYVCFRLAFFVPRRSLKTAWQEEVGPPQGAAYEPYKE